MSKNFLIFKRMVDHELTASCIVSYSFSNINDFCNSHKFTRASYSQYGSALDLVAPGGDGIDRDGDGYADGILQQTFDPNTRVPTSFGYWFFTGTSMAAPHVSGVAALLMAQGRTSAQTVEVLINTATDKGATGWDINYGYGLINAQAALSTPLGDINQPPVANAGSDIAAKVGETIAFDGSGSFDPEGSILSYSWIFGDGTQANGVTVSHTYSTAGIYTATLTVTDNDGSSDSDTVTVTVTAVTSLQTMHVESIAMSTSTRTAGKNTFVSAGNSQNR